MKMFKSFLTTLTIAFISFKTYPIAIAQQILEKTQSSIISPHTDSVQRVILTSDLHLDYYLDEDIIINQATAAYTAFQEVQKKIHAKLFVEGDSPKREALKINLDDIPFKCVNINREYCQNFIQRPRLLSILAEGESVELNIKVLDNRMKTIVPISGIADEINTVRDTKKQIN